eukprot:jgi/Chlat1/5293/Chrsp35S05195
MRAYSGNGAGAGGVAYKLGAASWEPQQQQQQGGERLQAAPTYYEAAMAGPGPEERFSRSFHHQAPMSHHHPKSYSNMGGNGNMGGGNGGVSAKIHHQASNGVAERFASLYTDLEAEKAARREAEAARRAALAEAADSALRAAVDTEIKAVQERLAAQARDTATGLRAAVDSVGRQCGEVSAALREEREQRRADMEHLAQSIVSKLKGVVAQVEETHAAVEDERVARLEREAVVLKRVGEDVLRVQEKVDAERVAREAAVAKVASEVGESLAARARADEAFRAETAAELTTLKALVASEREERVSEDDQIVQALNDYTRALQDGLRLVNN